MKKIFNLLNPRFTDFLERNPKRRMLGLYWSFLWRFFLFFYGSIIVLALVFGVAFDLFSTTDNTTDYAPTQGQGLDFVSTAKDNYDSCVLDAQIIYYEGWDFDCELEGKLADCDSLPVYKAEYLLENLNKSKDTCLELYKLEL